MRLVVLHETIHGFCRESSGASSMTRLNSLGVTHSMDWLPMMIPSRSDPSSKGLNDQNPPGCDFPFNDADVFGAGPHGDRHFPPSNGMVRISPSFG